MNDMSNLTAHLPGRLSVPDQTLEADPRLDPRIAAAMAMFPAFGDSSATVDPDASVEACLELVSAFEAAAAMGNEMLLAAMPPADNVEQSTQTIKGVDDNDITLYIHRPREADGPLPCIVHCHGGGMVLMSATDPGFIRLRNDLASAGAIVIGVEFRNGGGRLGNHPFPAGLSDCASAVQWAHDQRDALKLSSITLSGESGGGNLAIATALKANQEGWVKQIDGVYAMCPYISGAYANPPAELVSLIENDTYMLSCDLMAAFVRVYDPDQEHGSNPLAWPYQAKPGDLEGLPPHVVAVNELDPLRDEGLKFYRKLLDANVSAVARTIHGTPHAGDQMFPDITPDTYAETIRAIIGFARARS